MQTGTPRDVSVVVLGAGLSGLAAAQRLRERGYHPVVFERNSCVGGRACSHNVNGFIFDEGPHISFTNQASIRALFSKAVKGEFIEQNAKVLNYWKGHWVRHPAQCNLYGLPVDTVERCIVDFVTAKYESAIELKTYADWCYKSLGRAFSEEFTFPYTRKYWATEASNLTPDWIGPRVYPPKLEEVVRGALAPQDGNYHYISRFRYPRRGGYVAFAATLPENMDIRLGHEVVCIDMARRKVEFANGHEAYFDYLISSLPLPEFVKRIKDAPEAVARAAEKLMCTSVVLVNLGMKCPSVPVDAHWVYCYDENILFARLNFPHLLSPENVPYGSSIQAEVYHSKFRPLACRDVLSRTIEDLARIGIIPDVGDVAVAQKQDIDYANVLFVPDRAANLAVIQNHLQNHDVTCCGRYGQWAYMWSDDSVLSGWEAADRVAQVLRTRKGIANQ